MALGANNKDDDDKQKRQSSSKSEKLACCIGTVENHSRAAAPPERQETADQHLALVRATHEKVTGNRWGKSDSEAYDENGLEKVPVEKIISVLDAVCRRTPAKINSFRYFVKETVTIPDPRNRAWRKKQLEEIVRGVLGNAAGRAGYSTGDFIEDVKCVCAREAIQFDNDLFSELTG